MTNLVERPKDIQKRPYAPIVAGTAGADPGPSRQHDRGVNVTEESVGSVNSMLVVIGSVEMDLVGVGDQFDRA